MEPLPDMMVYLGGWRRTKCSMKLESNGSVLDILLTYLLPSNPYQ